MSRRPAVPLLCLAALAVLAARAQSPAPGPSEGGVVPGSADRFLMATIREIAAEVAGIRGQAFDRPPVAVRAPDTMRRVAGEIRGLNVVDARRLEARGRAWSDLGLATEETPSLLYRLLAADLRDIGFDPGGNRLLVAPDRLTASDFIPQPGDEGPSTVLLMTGVREDAPVVAHLLMHVRQRERVGGDWFAPATDELLARAAWAESEANLVALRYLFRGMGLDIVGIDDGPGPDAFLGGRLVAGEGLDRPDTLGSLLRFVYLDGYETAKRILAEGGWPSLEAAMSTRTTTADVMHVDRAVVRAREEWGHEPPREGLVPVDEDRLGEFAVFVLIAKWTGKDNLGLQAADGWAGDRLVRWEPADGRSSDPGTTEWRTSWGTAAAAAEFAEAAGRAWSARFSDLELAEPAPGVRALRAGDRLHRIVLEGTEVRILVGPPTDVDVPAAEAAPKSQTR